MTTKPLVKGKAIKDCPIVGEVCYPSCYFWRDGKCDYNRIITNIIGELLSRDLLRQGKKMENLKILKRQIEEKKTWALSNSSYASPESKLQYQGQLNAYDIVLGMIEKLQRGESDIK